MVLLVRAGVDRADIDDVLPMGVGEPLIGKRKAAQNNEQDAAPEKRFHLDRAAVKPSVSGPESS